MTVAALRLSVRAGWVQGAYSRPVYSWGLQWYAEGLPALAYKIDPWTHSVQVVPTAILEGGSKTQRLC